MTGSPAATSAQRKRSPQHAAEGLGLPAELGRRGFEWSDTSARGPYLSRITPGPGCDNRKAVVWTERWNKACAGGGHLPQLAETGLGG